MKSIVSPLVILATATSSIMATTIVGIESSGDYGHFNYASMGQQFFTGNTGVVVDSLTLRVTNNYAVTNSTGFTVGLYSESNNLPDTLLTTFTIQDPSYFAQASEGYDIPTYLTFDPDSTVTLDAASSYWIVMGNSNNYSWIYAQSAAFTGTGSFGDYMTNGVLEDWGDYPTAYDMTLTGSAAIPEPSASFLCLAGVASVMFRRRR